MDFFRGSSAARQTLSGCWGTEADVEAPDRTSVIDNIIKRAISYLKIIKTLLLVLLDSYCTLYNSSFETTPSI